MYKFILFLLLLVVSLNARAQNPALIAHFPLTSDVRDVSINMFDGQLIGGEFIQDEDMCNSLRIGNNQVDGVRLPVGIVNDLEQFTITFWARIDRLANSNNFLSGAKQSDTNDFIFSYNAVGFYEEDSWQLRLNNINYSFDGDTTMNDGKWHHVAIAYNSTDAILYIDTELVGDPILVSDYKFDLAFGGLILGQDQDCIGGCFEDDQSLNGNIAELRFYNVALAQEEVVSISQEFECVRTSTNSPALLKQSALLVYPNPNPGVFTIKANACSNNALCKYQATLYSMSGQVVYREWLSGNEERIQLPPTVVNGKYLLCIEDAKGVSFESGLISITR